MVHFKIFLLKSFKGFCIKELNGKEYFLSHQQSIKILYQLHVHTYIMCKSNCYKQIFYSFVVNMCILFSNIIQSQKIQEWWLIIYLMIELQYKHIAINAVTLIDSFSMHEFVDQRPSSPDGDDQWWPSPFRVR